MPSTNTLANLLTGAPFDPNNPLGLTAAAPGYLPADQRAPQRDPDLGWLDGMQPGGPGVPFSSLPIDVQNSSNQALIDWGNMDQAYWSPREQDPGSILAIAAAFGIGVPALYGLLGAGVAGAGAGAVAGAGDVAGAGAGLAGAGTAVGAGAVGATTVSELVVQGALAGMSIPEIAAAVGIPAATVGSILSSGGGPGGTANSLPSAVNPVAPTASVAPATGGVLPGQVAPELTVTAPAGTSGLVAPAAGAAGLAGVGAIAGGSGSDVPLPVQTIPDPGLGPGGDGIVPGTAPLGTPGGATDPGSLVTGLPGTFTPGGTGGVTGGIPNGLSGLIGPAVGAIGSIAGAGALGSAADASTALQTHIFDTTQKNLQPFIDTGTGALPQLANLAGTGPGGIAGEEAALRLTPGYKFNMDEGLNALLSKSTATGGVGGGNTLKALLGYSQGLADNTYQQQFNNTLSVASLGENAGAHLGSIGTQAGSNIGNSITQGGNAAAAGITGLTNQITGFLGTPAGQNFLANLFKSGG